MGKKGKKAQAGKPKKLTPKDVGKRLDVLAKKLGEELKDADLFTPLPPTEDCAICLVPLPRTCTNAIFVQYYMPCCGNTICLACYTENEASINKQNEEKNAGKKIVFTRPFCRKPKPALDEETLRQLQARCLRNDHEAFTAMGNVHRTGELGKAKDDLKALHYLIQAVELGSPEACVSIGNSYNEGDGVAVNKERAALFQRAGALRGNVTARHNVGLAEYYDLGNHEIGIRHWKIAAEAGHQLSLDALKKVYIANNERPGKQFIGKEHLDCAYRACHAAQMEVASEEREKHKTTNAV